MPFVASDSDQAAPQGAACVFPMAVLDQALRSALVALPQRPVRLAVALSGGADSAMLAVSAAHVARELGLALCFFHIHHGLQAAADDWAQRVRVLAGLLQTPLHEARIRVRLDEGGGMESAARDARYQALAELARDHAIEHILLAHHRDDQAETVLLRLLRGAGLQGMAAMAPQARRDGVLYLRPWLDIGRANILQAAAEFGARYGWAAVADPTNTDPRYTRAAVRTRLTPVLNERWPGWQGIVARHARHMAEAADILAEVAAEDLAGLAPADQGRSFSLAAWRELSAARQTQVLRHWLAINGARMPSDARLADLLRQLRQLHSLGHDRQLRLEHAVHTIRCHRGRVWIEPRV